MRRDALWGPVAARLRRDRPDALAAAERDWQPNDHEDASTNDR